MPKVFRRSVRWDRETANYKVIEELGSTITASYLDFQSHAWQEWLEQVSSFAFQSKGGHHFSARKEARGRGDVYWIAYRKIDGKLTHKYLGRPASVTLSRMEEVAADLSERNRQAGHPDAMTDHKERSRQSKFIDQLLSTKFFMPVSSHALIPRSRLFEMLDEGIRSSLTVVSAPAGFGKTTLLSSWIQALPKDDIRVAWVSLDEQDNDPVRFWLYVFTALDRLQPGICSEFIFYLQAQQSPPIQYLLTTLINRLTKLPKQWLLVLDDLHLVTEQKIFTSLTYLVEHLPPHLRIILASRSGPPLPLARLRARGQLVEVRADQLRTTTEEAATFLREVMRVDMSDQDLALVQQRTENWLVGLQLVGLSLQGGSAPTKDLLSEVGGDQNYILEYLTDEVLHRQPLSIQTFLLATSILEQLSAPLCDAVMEQQGSQHVLEQLERANLFIFSLDAERHWYRYHGLFAEALCYRLEQWEGEQVAALHRRASHWYAAHGFTSEAVGHALLARNWEQAAILIEDAVTPMLWQRSEFPLVQRWLKQLPPMMIRSRPRLSFAYAWVLYYISSAEAVIPWLEAAESGLAQQQAMSAALSAEEHHTLDDLCGEIFTLRAWMGMLDADGEKIRDLCQQALAYLSPDNRLARSEALFLQSLADFFLGDLLPAKQKALEGTAFAEQIGSVSQTILHQSWVMLCSYYRGQLQETIGIAQQEDQAWPIPSGLHLPMMRVVFYYQSLVLLEWNQLDAALDFAQQAIELKAQRRGFILNVYSAYTVLLEVQLARGDLEGAAAALQQAEHLLVAYLQDSWFFRALYLTSPQIRYWLRREQTEWVAQLLEKQLHRKNKPPASLARAIEECALVRLRLAQGRSQEALTLLTPLLEEATNRHWGKLLIELHILRALAYQAQNAGQAALESLAQAVHLAEPEGYITSFVNEGPAMAALLTTLREQKLGPTTYLDRLLAAFGQEGSVQAIPATAFDAISPREREVLQLLAQGYSNQEIAEALVVTAETVKRHVSSLLAKLGVDNRTQAAMRARSLGLLSDEL